MNTGSFRIRASARPDGGRRFFGVHVSPHPFRFEVSERGVWVRPCGVNGDDQGDPIDGALNAEQARQLAFLILRETSPQTIELRKMAASMEEWADVLTGATGDGDVKTTAGALRVRAGWMRNTAASESPEMEALRTLTAQLISWGRTGGASPASLNTGAKVGIEAIGESQNWALPTDGPKLGDSPPVDSEEWDTKPEIFGACIRGRELHGFVWNSDGYRCAHCYILAEDARKMEAENQREVTGDALAMLAQRRERIGHLERKCEGAESERTRMLEALSDSLEIFGEWMDDSQSIGHVQERVTELMPQLRTLLGEFAPLATRPVIGPVDGGPFAQARADLASLTDERDRLLDSEANLRMVAVGALGWLEALPLEDQPDSQWFEPLREAVARAKEEATDG